MEALHILIIDDHPAMIEGYRSILSTDYPPDKTIITTAYNCESAHRIITSVNRPFDIILLDLNLPPYPTEKLYSGEEVALLLQKLWPESKIIILTSHTETFLLFNLIKKLNPQGLLIKSDFTSQEFLTAFKKIINNEVYYTATAKQSLKEVYVKNNYLDAYNRRIISLLAKGITTKNLPHHLNISLSAIDKRKAQIKDILDIKKGNDEDIIREAKRNGFI